MKSVWKGIIAIALAELATSALSPAHATAPPAPGAPATTPSVALGTPLLQTAPLPAPATSATLKLDGFLCSSNPNLQGSFGLSDCISFANEALTNLSARTSHVIYFYYMGQNLVPNVSSLFAPGPTGGPDASFCQLSTPIPGKSGPGTPNGVPTPICNLGSVHGDESKKNNLGQACAPNGPVITPQNMGGTYSQGYCDFSAMSDMKTLPANVSINAMCPLETQWVGSLQPQFYENAYEFVANEVNTGTITLTTTTYQNTSVAPCQYFADSLNRLVLGQNQANAATGTGASLGILGLNGVRTSIQQFNAAATSSNQPELIYNDRDQGCNTNLAPTATSAQVTTVIDVASTAAAANGDGSVAVGTCSTIFAQRYAEFLFSQLLTCEVTTIAQRNSTNFQSPTLNPNLNPSATFKNALAAYATCEDYGQTTAGLVDGDVDFWKSPVAENALYTQCYLKGSVNNNYVPPIGMASVPKNGILSVLRNWASGSGDVTSPLYVKKGVLFPYQSLPNAPANYPACQMSIVPLFAASRKARRRAGFISLLILLLGMLILTSTTALATQTNYSLTCPNGSTANLTPNAGCVCHAKNMSCMELAYDNLEACYVTAQQTTLTQPVASVTNSYQTLVNTGRWNLTSVRSCNCDPKALTCTASINCSDMWGATTETVDQNGNFSDHHSICCNSGSSFFDSNQSHDISDPGCGMAGGDKGCKGDHSTGPDVGMSVVDYCQITEVLNPCDSSNEVPATASCSYQTALTKLTTDYTQCSTYVESAMSGTGPDAQRASFWAALDTCNTTLPTDLAAVTGATPQPGLAYQSALANVNSGLTNCNTVFTNAKAACMSAYSPSCTDLSNTMGTPPGDTNVFQEFMQPCNAGVAGGLAAACPPPSIAQPPPPIAAIVPANSGEQSLVDASLTLNHNGNMLGLQVQSTNAATAVDTTSKNFETPKAATSTSTAAAPGAGLGPILGPNGSATQTTEATNMNLMPDVSPDDVSSADSTADVSSAGGDALGFDASNGGSGSGRKLASNGNMIGGGANGLVNFGKDGSGDYAGSLGPSNADAVDRDEAYLHTRDASIFEIVNRRYHRKTPELLGAPLQLQFKK